MPDSTESLNRDLPSAVDSDQVLKQLDRMLKSRHFRNSRRYPAFLSYIVRRRLEGDLDSLKERILGIEVFQRAHDYDTAADPVVRITAGEVRKRIALYYHDEETEGELRIELPAGSYVPVFVAIASGVSGTAVDPVAEITENSPPDFPITEPETVNARRPRTVGVALWSLVGVLALVLLAAVLGYRAWISSPVEAMWRPFLRSDDPVLVVIGSPLGSLAGPVLPPGTDPRTLDSHSHVHLAFTDALALTNVTGLLETHKQGYRVQTSGTTSLDDLRHRPAILITGFSNSWSGRVLSGLRYSLLRQQISADGTTRVGSIIDQRTGGPRWSFDFSKPVGTNTRDYAVIARLQSDLTDGPVMVLAGLGPTGTESAGEFISSPGDLAQVAARAPSNWRTKNLELVLEVPVIDGKAGHARVIAADFW